MNKAITKAVAEATRVSIQAIAEVQSQRSEGQQGPKLGSPALKHPQLNWETTDKYTEWKVFILEVRNILSKYNAQEQDKTAMVKNWLGKKRLHYLESLTEAEKHACDTLQGLFDTLATNSNLNLMRQSSCYSLENYTVLRVETQKSGWVD